MVTSRSACCWVCRATIPQATSDRSTSTRDSSAKRRRRASERCASAVVVSANADVVRDGGREGRPGVEGAGVVGVWLCSAAVLLLDTTW